MTEDEIARVVFDGETVTTTGGEEPTPGTHYVVRLQCTAAAGRTVTYSVDQGDEPISRGEARCDAEPYVNSVGDVTGALSLTLDGDLGGVTSAYAVVVLEA